MSAGTGADAPRSFEGVREYPQGARTAADAAAAIGCDVGQIVKSLVFRDPAGEPVLVLCSGANTVDEAALGVTRADAAFVREVTGFAIGGVAPVRAPGAAADAGRRGPARLRRGVGGGGNAAPRLPADPRAARRAQLRDGAAGQSRRMTTSPTGARSGARCSWRARPEVQQARAGARHRRCPAPRGPPARAGRPACASSRPVRGPARRAGRCTPRRPSRSRSSSSWTGIAGLHRADGHERRRAVELRRRLRACGGLQPRRARPGRGRGSATGSSGGGSAPSCASSKSASSVASSTGSAP